MSGIIQSLVAVTTGGAPPPPGLTITADGSGWYQTETGSPYFFVAFASASGGSGNYSYVWSDGYTTGPSYGATWNEASPPQIDIYCSVHDNGDNTDADSNTVSSTPP